MTIKTLEAPEALAILDFWLTAGPSKWFAGGAKFDEACKPYEALWERGAAGELDDWAQTSAGCLALIILLDQIPRNIFRGDAKQFSTDAKAIELTRFALQAGYDKACMSPVTAFLYMPLMHSEDLDDQRLCCDLFHQSDMKENYHFALIHMDAIARFGRFPHRNDMLGRETTPEEAEYLKSGGFGA
ncbi:DUF924 family protein [Ponticaulis sp.]|uniref:DUF924 family protein n=1 Tax=Ponticaulis sp. TaxID=2020902 RepID=UPI000B6FEA3F|nr:DUF924 family protein [Ponticaulis sp.]MAI91446.1 hypothetical protein [Ponticaulis sp.]OUX97803.1 MAG: hypothetical protein CBB65_13470 [Hyphomonadaceae bacterium TMED5]|tara:strand:+ start:46662 stop:47219 length:558 start_codon:yes stop_codon:yes gene_type:complete